MKQNNENKTKSTFDVGYYKKLSKLSSDELLDQFKTSTNGLTDNEAHKRLAKYGPNSPIKDNKKSWFYFFITAFKDQFVIILLFLAVINYGLGDHLGSIIIVAIALTSVMIRFVQDYDVYKFNRTLKKKIYNTCTVIRGGTEKVVKIENTVPGDIIRFNAGAIVPGDVMLIESKDLFVNQSAFTGESVPVEKRSGPDGLGDIFNIENLLLMNSTVVTGSGAGVIVASGLDTYIGQMGKEFSKKRDLTNFDKGINRISQLLIRYMVIICLVVFVVDGVIKNNMAEALLFALSVAVGITPSMLPMIVNVNLTKGSKKLMQKKVLVKELRSIQNLGAIDILCTDKTGTLTENRIVLQKYVDVNGKDNKDLLKYAYLNSVYSTGMKNIVDKAILNYGKKHGVDKKVRRYDKVDEIPFDYERKKSSIAVKSGDDYLMITKGALEKVVECANKIMVDGKVRKLYPADIDKLRVLAKELAGAGMQVITLAIKPTYDGPEKFNKDYESGLIVVGLIAFLDQPKVGVKKVLNKLSAAGVQTKILTGDSLEAASSICTLAGIDTSNALDGKAVDRMSDTKLKRVIDKVSVFARLNPLQKERIIRLYREKGHVVGFMGDGVNDALALHKADIGISVNSATSVAKEASDIILLERSLNVIYDGVIEGRVVYGNIIKYIKMALSGDFGDVFSIMIASIFLPFLPLLPIQMLIQDFIYDFSQIGIPYDNVDPEFLERPKKWDTHDLSRFMQIMGIASSVVDVVSFLIFWFVLGYNSPAKSAYFQTAWFVTCLITELMIIMNVRTAKKPFVESRPSKQLFGLTLFSCFLTIVTPIALNLLGLKKTFDFIILPPQYYLFLVLLVVLYFGVVTVIKKLYIRKYHEWL